MSSARSVLLGVDVGTARVKAVAFGLEGDELAHVERPTPWVKHEGTIEMDAEHLASVIRAVVADVAGKAELDESSGVRVTGIGVTGMGEAGVLVDRGGAPLHRIVGWHDPRGDVETVRREIGAEVFECTVGMPLNSQPSLPKIVWLQRLDPALARGSRFLSVPEWAVVSLGGSPVSELSLASRTGLLDIGKAAPFEGAAELVGGNLLSELVVAGTPAGTARHEALPVSVRGAILTVAGHDHQAAALAVGAARPDALFNSMGSAESLARCVEGSLDPAAVGRLAAQGTTVGRGVVRGRSAVLGGLRTGLELEEIATLLGAHDRESRRRLSEDALVLDPTTLPAEVVSNGGGAGRVPGLLAEGISRAAIWAGAVRDLTALSTHLLERMSLEVGPYGHVTVAGGWARNASVLAEKRRQLGEITVSPLREAGSAGAALLAGVAADMLELPEADPSPIWSLRATVLREKEAL
ncbi:MAG: FGGY family carbohydrate kinase [Actinomycetota bacterium]